MSIDVVDLRNFYAQPLGMVARRFVEPRHPRALRRYARPARPRRRLCHALSRLVPRGGGALPRLHAGRARRGEMAVGAARRSRRWSTNSICRSPTAAVDRVLLVHALEMAHDAEALLREVWRVLASGGRLLAVIPNRRGVWARTDTTPFGHGRPYSRSQITHLLRETWFTPTGWGEALYVPPIARNWFLRSAVAWERTGATHFGAVRRRAHRRGDQAGLSRDSGTARAATAGANLEPVLAPSPEGRRDAVDLRRVCPARSVPPPGACRAARDGAGGGDAAGSDQAASSRSRGRSGLAVRCGCGAPPVMKAGSRLRHCPAPAAAVLPRLLRLLALSAAAAARAGVAVREGLRVARHVGLLARAERLGRAGWRSSAPPRGAPRGALECFRRRAGPRSAAWEIGFSGGTAPARQRSGGNNVRRVGSNSRLKPDRRRSARRVQAAGIFPQCDGGAADLHVRAVEL